MKEGLLFFIGNEIERIKGEINMPYIEYCPFGEGHFEKMYYHKTDEKKTYYCDPACFKWISENIEEKDHEKIRWMEIVMPFEQLITRNIKGEYEPFTYLENLSKFKLEKEDIPSAVGIYTFFKYYERNKKDNPTKRISQAIRWSTYPKIDENTMKRLVRFVFNDYAEHPEKIKIFLDPDIHPYLVDTKKDA